MVNATRYFVVIVILLSLILFITTVNSLNIFHITFPSFSDAIENHQGLIAIVGLIIFIIFFRIGQIIDNNTRKEEFNKRFLTTCSMISLEVGQFKDAVSDNTAFIDDGTNIPYMNYILNLDGYNSILSSGLLSYFGKNTQDMIKRLYERVRLHNDMLLYKVKYEDDFFLYDYSEKRFQKWLERGATRYNSILNTYEEDIRALIPEVESSIEADRKKASL